MRQWKFPRHAVKVGTILAIARMRIIIICIYILASATTCATNATENHYH